MMNMLNTEMRVLASFNAKEIIAFREADKNNLLQFVNSEGYWEDKNKNCNPNMFMNNSYRLKLKEGEWYTAKTKNHSFCYKCGVVAEDRIYNQMDGMYLIFDELEVFQPATKEEIESVKPKDECFVDVEIEWECEDSFGAFLKDMNSLTSDEMVVELCGYSIGIPSCNWVLSKYVFDDQIEGVDAKFTAETAIIFNNDGTKIAIKATHARFIKL